MHLVDIMKFLVVLYFWIKFYFYLTLHALRWWYSIMNKKVRFIMCCYWVKKVKKVKKVTCLVNMAWHGYVYSVLYMRSFVLSLIERPCLVRISCQHPELCEGGLVSLSQLCLIKHDDLSSRPEPVEQQPGQLHVLLCPGRPDCPAGSESDSSQRSLFALPALHIGLFRSGCRWSPQTKYFSERNFCISRW